MRTDMYTEAMALIIPPGFAQAVYIHQLAGDNEPIVTTCGHDIGDFVGTPQELANRLHSNWKTEPLVLMSNQYTSVGVDVYIGQDGGPPLVANSTTVSATGGATGGPLPQNCAALVRKRTGAAGRRGRGRMYWPGVAEGDVGPTGVLTEALRTSLQNRYAAWLALLVASPAGSGPVPPVILHRAEGTGVEPPPTVITAFQVDTRVATQRRRLRK